MPVWSDLPRPDPEPCRAGDEGLFEVTVRDGRARLGKLHTKHGILITPALLPVINPNIRTIEPREMWDRYGIGALITNSYIIRKHPELSDKALKDGVHALLDYPGVVMTDSMSCMNVIYDFLHPCCNFWFVPGVFIAIVIFIVGHLNIRCGAFTGKTYLLKI